MTSFSRHQPGDGFVKRGPIGGDLCRLLARTRLFKKRPCFLPQKHPRLPVHYFVACHPKVTAALCWCPVFRAGCQSETVNKHKFLGGTVLSSPLPLDGMRVACRPIQSGGITDE